MPAFPIRVHTDPWDFLISDQVGIGQRENCLY